MFVHPPPILPPPTTTYFYCHHLDSPSTTRDNPASGPSPLLRDVGPNLHSAYSERHPPLPFPEGCGRLKLARWRNGVGRDIRGDQRRGPSGVSRRRTTMKIVVRFLHSIIHSIQLTASPPNASVTTHVKMKRSRRRLRSEDTTLETHHTI